jgi:hypothetical protein
MQSLVSRETGSSTILADPVASETSYLFHENASQR